MTTTYKATSIAVLKSLGLVALFVLPGATIMALLLMIPESAAGGLFFLLFVPLFLLCASSVFLIVLALGAFMHNLTHSPAGLEYQRWPLKRITANWTEVEAVRVRKRTGSATLLVRRTRPGFELDLGFMTLGSKTYKLIPLSDFTGWREGNLLEEMRGHLPKLKVVPPYINVQVAVVDDRGQPSSR